MITSLMVDYLKENLFERLESFTELGLVLELAGNPHNLAMEDIFRLQTEFAKAKQLYLIIYRGLDRHIAFTEAFPSPYYYDPLLPTEVVTFLLGVVNEASEILNVLGLVMELATCSSYKLTEVDFARVQLEIKNMIALLNKVLNMDVVPIPTEPSPIVLRVAG